MERHTQRIVAPEPSGRRGIGGRSAAARPFVCFSVAKPSLRGFGLAAAETKADEAAQAFLRWLAPRTSCILSTASWLV